jgi:mono/diheme cytochrome c family protein
VNASTARNLLHIVLDGLHPASGERGAIMPGFGDALTDAQVVAVVQYVRARFSDRPQWAEVAKTLREVRQEAAR